MHPFHEMSETRRHHQDHPHQGPAVLTYRRIAEILRARRGASVSAARVARTCRQAEIKLGIAFLLAPALDSLALARAHGPQGPHRRFNKARANITRSQS